MCACMPLTKEMLPNRVIIKSTKTLAGFDEARRLADEKALEIFESPMLMAWFDSREQKFSPNIECCQENKPSWLVYAETRGGEFSVDINDLEYVFVYRQG